MGYTLGVFRHLWVSVYRPYSQRGVAPCDWRSGPFTRVRRKKDHVFAFVTTFLYRVYPNSAYTGINIPDAGGTPKWECLMEYIPSFICAPRKIPVVPIHESLLMHDACLLPTHQGAGTVPRDRAGCPQPTCTFPVYYTISTSDVKLSRLNDACKPRR